MSSSLYRTPLILIKGLKKRNIPAGSVEYSVLNQAAAFQYTNHSSDEVFWCVLSSSSSIPIEPEQSFPTRAGRCKTDSVNEREKKKNVQIWSKPSSKWSDMHMKVKVLVTQCVRVFATQWTVAHQALLSMETSRQEYWSVLPFPSPGDQTWVYCTAGRFFTVWATREAQKFFLTN